MSILKIASPYVCGDPIDRHNYCKHDRITWLWDAHWSRLSDALPHSALLYAAKHHSMPPYGSQQLASVLRAGLTVSRKLNLHHRCHQPCCASCPIREHSVSLCIGDRVEEIVQIFDTADACKQTQI